MAVLVDFENPDDHNTFGQRHVWEKPESASRLGDCFWLVARWRQKIVGTWLVPYDIDENGIYARRRVRILPYAAPWIDSNHPRKRRTVLFALIKALQTKVNGIDLPLAPLFHDYGALCAAGCFLEARQTHWFRYATKFHADALPALRNKLRKVQKNVVINIHHNADQFDFNKGIVNTSQDHRLVRRAFALASAEDGSVTIVDAIKNSKVIGQSLALASDQWQILLHSWFDKSAAEPGVSPLMTASFIDHTVEKQGVVDMAGSILATIDEYMDGLGGTLTPYSILYWHQDIDGLLDLIRSAVEIPGRINK